jgi:hypothetical protein
MKRNKMRDLKINLLRAADAVAKTNDERYADLRKFAKVAREAATKLASYARSRERTSCKHDWQRANRSMYVTCAHCHVCRWDKEAKLAPMPAAERDAI